MTLNKYDVVQFNENHQWCGAIGFIDGIKDLCDDIRYMIGVQIPMQGVTYIFSLKSKDELEYIGHMTLIPKSEESDEEN